MTALATIESNIVQQQPLDILRRESTKKYLDVKLRRLGDSLLKDPTGAMREGEEEHFTTSLYTYMEEIGAGEDTPLEVQSCIELAVLDILEQRVLKLLSAEGEVVDSISNVIVDGDGVVHPFTIRMEHPSFGILKLLWTRRSGIRRELASTREQKLKLVLEGRKDSVEWMTEMMARARSANPGE